MRAGGGVDGNERRSLGRVEGRGRGEFGGDGWPIAAIVGGREQSVLIFEGGQPLFVGPILVVDPPQLATSKLLFSKY